MTDKTFLADMEELLELDAGSLGMEQTLVSSGKWDSLNFVAFLAMAHSKYGVRAAPAEVRACKTFADLLKLLPAA